jgi:putative oxidoreductase
MKKLNIIVWVLQVILAAFFIYSGLLKLTSHELIFGDLRPIWFEHVPSWMPVLAGSLEVLGGVGIILPAITRISPVLVPLSLFSLTLFMAVAYALQVWTGDNTSELALILMFVTAELGWLRLKVIPIAAKQVSHSTSL